MRLTILHTNDVHGSVDGLARVATVVARVRRETEWPVLYLDAGDVEETTTRISNITKGAAMHRLLSAAGCDAHTIGNAAWLRYGMGVLAEHGRSAAYPLLLANMRAAGGEHLPGTQPSVLLERGGVRVAVIGVTAPFEEFHENIDFGAQVLDEVEAVREEERRLRRERPDLVVVLSHLGLDVPATRVDDRRLAQALAGRVDLIVGAHTHHLLLEGELVGGVLVAQAGDFAQHVGRVDVTDDGLRATTIPVEPGEEPHPDVVAVLEAIEPEVEATLAEVIGELRAPLDETRGAAWLAEILRARMGAEVAIVAPGQAFAGGLAAGELSRGALWDVCTSTANPGVTELTGERLEQVIAKGRDADFAGTTPRPLRGQQRGVLQVSGPDRLEPDRVYTVAATDWELEPYGGLVPADWRLRVRYDFPTIVREAIEEHLAAAR